MELKKTKTAIELGFEPNYQPMDQSQSELIMKLIIASIDGSEKDIPEAEKPFAIKMIEKRIQVLKLPITLKPSGKVAMLILTEGNPGRMNVALIDILTKKENQTVGVEQICEKIYPDGFYTEESVTEYINTYLKTKQTKWSEIY